MKKFVTRSAMLLTLALALAGCNAEQKNDASDAASEAVQTVSEAASSVAELASSAAEDAQSALESAASDAAADATIVRDYAALKESLTKGDDGVYTGTGKDGETIYYYEKEVDKHGWAPVGMIAVKDGAIVDSGFNYVGEGRKLKSEDQSYIDAMKKGSGKDIRETLVYLDGYLKTSTDLSAVSADVVTGATSTGKNFQDVAGVLLKAAGLN